MADQDNKKRKKFKNPKEYLNDFVLNDDGGYSYTGRRYTVDRHYAFYGDVYRKLLIGAIIMAACSVGSGMIDAAGATGAFYVVIPFIGEISALFAMFWNIVKLMSQGEVVKEYAFQSVDPGRGGCAHVFCAYRTGDVHCVYHHPWIRRQSF